MFDHGSTRPSEFSFASAKNRSNDAHLALGLWDAF